jgi:methoxymalonate biosynthesis acyl carrier protein
MTSNTRDQRKSDLLQVLRKIQRDGMPVESLDEQDQLVASGLIDSMAILQIVLYLEANYSMDFSTRGVDPVQLGTIGNILDMIEKDTKG